MDSANVSSSSVSSGCKRKRSIGRQKIAIEPILNEPARQVCFSKRRNGLFKKAQELAVLCGAHIKIVVSRQLADPIHISTIQILQPSTATWRFLIGHQSRTKNPVFRARVLIEGC